MSDLESFRNVTAALGNEYGLSNVRSLVPIVSDLFFSGKTAIRNVHLFSVDSDQGPFVFKMQRSLPGMSSVEIEERFLLWAEAKNFPLTPRIVRTRSGKSSIELSARPWILMSRIKGNFRSTWIDPRLSKDALIASGKALGLYHDLVSELKPEDLGLAAGPPGSILIHADFHPGNVIFERHGDSTRVNGIVDFEFARFDNFHLDVAYALVTFASRAGDDGTVIDASARSSFLDGYASVLPGTIDPIQLTEYVEVSCRLVLNWLDQRIQTAQKAEIEEIHHAVRYFMSLASRLSKMVDGNVIM